MRGPFSASWGTTTLRMGDAKGAIEHHDQALAISREIGNRRGEGNTLGNLDQCQGGIYMTVNGRSAGFTLALV